MHLAYATSIRSRSIFAVLMGRIDVPIYSERRGAVGTLFNQAPREYRSISKEDVDDFLSDVLDLARKHKISVSDVLSARAVLESARAGDFAVRNGDILDEQMMGFGELLQELTSAIQSLKAQD